MTVTVDVFGDEWPAYEVRAALAQARDGRQRSADPGIVGDRAVLRRWDALVRPRVGLHQRIVDWGCGTGIGSRRFLERFGGAEVKQVKCTSCSHSFEVRNPLDEPSNATSIGKMFTDTPSEVLDADVEIEDNVEKIDVSYGYDGGFIGMHFIF